jgi:acyl-ACP thioesterase
MAGDFSDEAELSNGDTIEIDYRIAPSQSTQFLTPDAIHQYLRRVVERERVRRIAWPT